MKDEGCGMKASMISAVSAVSASLRPLRYFLIVRIEDAFERGDRRDAETAEILHPSSFIPHPSSFILHLWPLQIWVN